MRAEILSLRRKTNLLEHYLLPALGLPLDVALVSFSFYCAYMLRFHFGPVIRHFPPPSMQPFASYREILPALIPFWLMVFLYSAKLYSEPHASTEDVIVKSAHGCLVGTVLTFAVSSLLKGVWHSRLMFMLLLPVSMLLVCLGNLLVRKLHLFVMNHAGLRMRVLVVGGGKPAELACACLGRASWRECRKMADSSKKNLMATVNQNSITHVVLANSSFGKTELMEIADELALAGVELSLVPGIVELRTGEVQLDSSLGMPVMHIYHTSFSGYNYFIKRSFDIFLSLAVMICGLLPFLVIAALIKLNSSGPVFFRQKRVGRNGGTFDIYKFRTMGIDAERQLAALSHLNERTGNVFKMKNDPRVTSVGKWLRRLSLDEFPQFINVLRGEMSIAGPRPPTVNEYLEYSDEAKKRLHVLPGITGLWQVSGRADLDFEQMLALDFYYIEHWSLGLDLRIVIKTPLAMISVKGAY